LFFMHLKWEADWKYVLTIPASVMSVFLVLALVPDIGRRVNGFYPYSDHRLEYVADSEDASALVNASKHAHGDEQGPGPAPAPLAAPTGTAASAASPAPAATSSATASASPSASAMPTATASATASATGS